MRIVTLMTAATVISLGTSVFAQRVTFDFDRTAPFAKYKTYAWTRGTELSDQLNHARVVRSVENQLASKGFARVEASAHPDVLVAYHASFEKNLQINGFSSGIGPLGLGGNRSGTARAQEIVVGTLVVEMSDANTKALVWRGMANKDIDVNASPEKREKNIDRTAERIFKNYPPRK